MLAAPIKTNAAHVAEPAIQIDQHRDLNAMVAVFSSHQKVQDALRELQKTGFDLQQLSVAGKDYYTKDEVVGFYTRGDGAKVWGNAAAFWDGVWGQLSGSAFFIMPGIGPVLAAGPLVSSIIDELESATTAGGTSALAKGLCSLGVPRENVAEYESQIKAGKLVLLAQGTFAEVDRAQTALASTPHDGVQKHNGSS